MITVLWVIDDCHFHRGNGGSVQFWLTFKCWLKGLFFFTFHSFTSLQIFSWNSICVLSGHFLWGTFHISRISMSVSMRHEIFTLVFLLSLGRSTARLIYQECSLPMHIHCCLCSLKNVLFENSTHAYNVFDQIHSCSLSPSSSLPLSCHHFFPLNFMFLNKQTKTRIHLALLCMLVEEKCNLSS